MLKRPSFWLAVLAVSLLAAASATFAVLYFRASDRADRFSARVVTLRADVLAARLYARNQYTKGMNDERAINKSLGLTYDAGWKAVFSGFRDPWLDGSWYLVKVDHGKHGHELVYRVDVRPCQRTYLSNDEIYTQGYAC